MNSNPPVIHEVFAYLRVRDAAKAIDFYTRAFGARERFRLTEPNGRIGHAELEIGPAVLMLSDEYPEYDLKGPQSLGATTFSMHLHVDNADAAMQRAVDAGATQLRAPTDQFYGERGGTLRDPFGHEWAISSHTEDLSTEEIKKRAEVFMAKMASGA